MMEPKLSLTEAQEQVKDLAYPRVTEAAIKAKIAKVEYLIHDITTICIITMQNDFRFIGHSTPADLRNYYEEIGKRYAYENAFKQIWPHEGYLLREKLAND